MKGHKRKLDLLFLVGCLWMVMILPGCPPETECPDGQVMCSDKCVSLETDHSNCGVCGRSCDSGSVCSGGQCTITCQPTQSNCGGVCTDMKSDRSNCGVCGRLCDSGSVCSGGQCTITCQPTQSNCGGVCTDMNTDRSNCGACSRLCESGMVCSGGTCSVSCPNTLSICGGECLNFDTDRNACGACGRTCGQGEICAGGYCTASCAPPLVPCAGACVDTRHDPAHCGGCDNPCGEGQVCAGVGGCKDVVGGPVDPCPEGQKLCKGQCADLTSDLSHCGECEAFCDPGEACVAGQCRRDAFRILGLMPVCSLVDDTSVLDSPMGPMGFGGGMLYYSGETHVLGYDFLGSYAVQASPAGIPTLTYDLANHQLWSLGNAQGWASAANVTISHLVPVGHYGSNSLVAGVPLPLSESFLLPTGAGLFAGLGLIGVHTGEEFLLLDTDTGEVTRKPSPSLAAAPCKGPFFFGVIEHGSNGLMLVYVQADTDAVVRTRPADGATQVVLQGEMFADMCGLAVDIDASSWCFHVSEMSQFDNQNGQSWALCCMATFLAPGIQQN